MVRDPLNELALLEVRDASNLPPALPLASVQPQVGERVFTVGYRFPAFMGRGPKVAKGIVNAMSGMAGDPRVLQISTALEVGNSGGPLLNTKGEVVGIAVGKPKALMVFEWPGDLQENVGYAIKVAYLRALLDSAPGGRPRLPELEPVRKPSLKRLAGRIRPSVLSVVAE